MSTCKSPTKAEARESAIKECLRHYPNQPNAWRGSWLHTDHPHLFASAEAARKAVSRYLVGRPDVKTRRKISAQEEARLYNDGDGLPYPKPAKQVEVDFKGDTGTATTSPSSRIKTYAQALAAADYDANLWEPERHKINSWESAAMVKGEWKVQTLYQVTIWFKRKPIQERPRDMIEPLLKALRAEPFKPAKCGPFRKATIITERNRLVELCTYDLHVGKYSWDDETGDNYDTDIACQLHINAIDHFVARVADYVPEKFLWTVGNDFFNSDDHLGQTTAGTHQDEDGRYQRTFNRGVKAITDGVKLLLNVAPVEIVIVPGNHDSQRAYYLGEVLSAYYRETKHVTVDNAPRMRKWRAWGNNVLGLTHGKEEKHGQLPIIFASECPEWSRATHREIHIGHFHKKGEYLLACDEEQSTRLRVIPSLAGRDAWHYLKGYAAQRGAEAHLWHRDGGIEATFNYMVK